MFATCLNLLFSIITRSHVWTFPPTLSRWWAIVRDDWQKVFCAKKMIKARLFSFQGSCPNTVNYWLALCNKHEEGPHKRIQRQLRCTRGMSWKKYKASDDCGTFGGRTLTWHLNQFHRPGTSKSPPIVKDLIGWDLRGWTWLPLSF